MAEQLYDLTNIRTLLTEGFSDEELRRLCFDVSDLRTVYDSLARNSSKAEIIDRLLESAERRMQMEVLLAEAQRLNPVRYKAHRPYVLSQASAETEAEIKEPAKLQHQPAIPEGNSVETVPETTEEDWMIPEWLNNGPVDKPFSRVSSWYPSTTPSTYPDRLLDEQYSDRSHSDPRKYHNVIKVFVFLGVVLAGICGYGCYWLWSIQLTPEELTNLYAIPQKDTATAQAAKWRLTPAPLSCYPNCQSKSLIGADLEEGSLGLGNFSEANLNEANLRNAYLAEAHFIKSELTGADLTAAYLFGADLTGAMMSQSDLVGANLSYAKLLNTDLTKADLTGAQLFNADLTGAKLQGATLTGTDFFKARMPDGRLFESNYHTIDRLTK